MRNYGKANRQYLTMSLSSLKPGETILRLKQLPFKRTNSGVTKTQTHYATEVDKD
jgi:hypothetical protein